MFHRLTEYKRMPNELDVETYGNFVKGDSIVIDGLQNPCRFQKAVFIEIKEHRLLKYLQVVDRSGYIKKVRNPDRIVLNP